MRINFRHIFVLLLLLASVTISSVQAMPQKAVVNMDTSSIRIGERVRLRLNVTLPKTATIYWPPILDTLSSSVEVASRSKIDTGATIKNDMVSYTQSLWVTSFDTGFHYIPPFRFLYSNKGDTVKHELLSENLFLKVRTVDVDTTRAIRDIRGPLKAPITLAELAPYIGGGAIILLIVGLVWYYLWRKKMNKPLFPVLAKHQGPPWEVALQALDLLETKKLWHNGKIKEYYTELTDIIRLYLFDQHGIEAMEMITSEILSKYDTAGLDPNSRALLSNMLIQADFAKFAKANPMRSENEQCMVHARQFIENTKPHQAETDAKHDKGDPKPISDTDLKA